MINDIIYTNDNTVFNKKEIDVKIGSKIRAKRKEKRITIVDLADKMETSTTYVSQVEKGEYGISLYKFILICYFLKIDAYEFLKDFVGDIKIKSNFSSNSKDLSLDIINFIKNSNFN